MSRSPHRPFRWALAVCLLLPATAWLAPVPEQKPAQDWPLFRGNALQTGVAAAPLPAKLEKLWTFASGDSIESAPAVFRGVVYLASMDELSELTRVHPRLARYVGPPCVVRNGLISPRCTEGTHFCGVPVWRDFPHAVRRL